VDLTSFASTSAPNLRLIHTGKNVTNTSKKGNPARNIFSAISMMTKMGDLGYLWQISFPIRKVGDSAGWVRIGAIHSTTKAMEPFKIDMQIGH